MRTIKFRGYNRKNKEWLYGFYLQNRGSHFVCPDEFAGGKSWEDYEVDSDTVGQYTEMKDEKSREIWEGDIVEITSLHYETLMKKCTCVVSYDRACFWLYRIDACELKQSLTSAELENSITIVGNIHDDPEHIADGSKTL